MAYRVYETLDELVDILESARGVLMSGSCAVPRAHVLDLLDDLREALPVEVAEAQTVLDTRDDLITQGRSAADQSVADAHDEARRIVAEAHAHAERLSLDAAGRAEQIEADALARRERLVSDTVVVREAQSRADRFMSEATQRAHAVESEARARAADVEAEARAHAHQVISEATAEAEDARRETHEYVDARLAQMQDSLSQALHAVEGNRRNLHARAAGSAAGRHPRH